MCDRIGCMHMPNFKSMDFSRRNFLKATAATTLTMAVGPGMMGAAHAASAIKSTHGSGFCNLNIFLSHALQTAKEDGLDLVFVNTPTFAEQVTFLGIGQVDVGLMPYTSFMALYDAGAPVKMVAGGGIEGCVIVSRPGLDTPEKLKGKTLGTFQLDTLEVMPYDWLKKHGVNFKDVKVRYMGNTPEAVEAFKAGAIDWICTIEPYGTALVNDVKGAHLLSDGTRHLRQGLHRLRARLPHRPDQENPAALKAVIKGMMKAQSMAETKPEETLNKLIGTYYKTSIENAKIAMSKQPAVVDARNQTQFILDRTDSLVEMGYIKKKPGRDAIDWTLLEQVIAENKDLYASSSTSRREPVRCAATSLRGRLRAAARRRLGLAVAARPAPLAASAGACSRSACSPGSGKCCGMSAVRTRSCCRRRTSSWATSPARRKFFNTAHALADRRRPVTGPSPDDGGAASPCSPRRARPRRPADRGVLSISIGMPIRYFRLFGKLDAADHHAALAGLADRLAAGGDLPVRHRRRAGDLHGGDRAVLPHGAGDRQPDRRCATAT